MQVTVARTVLILTALAAPAFADDEDRSEAQKLFEEGRVLLDAGKTDPACEKFELSIAKDPRAVGTLLNLGLCNERRGKVATALKLFQEAFDRAGEAGLTQHRDAAQEHITKLVPQVPVVSLRVTDAISGQSLFVDDVGVKDPAKELQLDPGPHKVVATAPGRLPFEKSFPLAASERKTVDVPALEKPKSSTIIRATSSRRTIGKVATISGAGLLVVGSATIAYGYRAYHKQFDNGNCEGKLCNDVGQDQTTRARNIATAGIIVGIIGVVALGGGVALWATAPKESSTTIVPSTTPDGTGVSLSISRTF